MCADVPRRQEHGGLRMIPIAFLVQMFCAKKNILRKLLLWPFVTSRDLTIDATSKQLEPMLKLRFCLSIAFWFSSIMVPKSEGRVR